MESALYTGTVRHRRFAPVEHEFRYFLFMAFLDIDRIPQLLAESRLAGYNRANWASFYEADHFGDATLPLRERIAQSAADHGVALPDGPIFLLTHLRYLGYNFNPVSFYFCYNRGGEHRATLAEVRNTFGESHNYWLTTQRESHEKRMHVSPFLPMDMDYDFAFNTPGESLAIHMATRRTLGVGAGAVGAAAPSVAPIVDATLTMRRQPWTAANLRHALIRFPWMTAKVITAIHWEALRLWAKKTPVYSHPGGKGWHI